MNSQPIQWKSTKTSHPDDDNLYLVRDINGKIGIARYCANYNTNNPPLPILYIRDAVQNTPCWWQYWGDEGDIDAWTVDIEYWSDAPLMNKGYYPFSM